jgi:hypothetical protein
MYPWFINRGYISYAHTEGDIDRTIEATDQFLTENQDRLAGDGIARVGREAR